MEPITVPDSSRLTFRVPLRTRWVDEDNQGVLNNAVYMTLFEEARHHYFEHLGLLEGNRFPFLLAQAGVRFVAPGTGGVTCSVEMTTTRLGRSSFDQAYRVRGPGGDTWCESVAVLVCYDPATQRSAPMKPAFRTALIGAAPELASGARGGEVSG